MTVFYATELQTTLYSEDDEYAVTIVVRGNDVVTLYTEKVEGWVMQPYYPDMFSEEFRTEVEEAKQAGIRYINRGYELETE